MSRPSNTPRRFLILLMAILPITLSCQGPVAPTQSTPRPRPSLSPVALASPSSPTPADSGTPTPEAPVTPEADSTPVDGPWTVSLDVTKDPGTSHVSGYSIKVSSDGVVESSHWQNGVAVPKRHVTTSKVPLEALTELKTALGQPRLSRGPSSVGQGRTVLIITRAGVARTFRTEREAFVGPPGKVQQSLLGIGAKKPEAQATP